MTNNVVFYLYNVFGDYMKKIFIFSITFGFIFSLLLFLNYRKNMNDKTELNKLYFFQISAYKDLKNAANKTKYLESYIVIKEKDQLYHIYIGLTKSLKNVSKIKEFYNKNGNNIYVREKNVNCKNFIKDLDNYEILLSSAESKESIEKIEREVLKKYKEYNCENIRNG